MSKEIPRYGDVITPEGMATLEFHVFLEDLSRDIDLKGPIEVEDEGTPLTTNLTKLNFVGSGVVASEPVAGEIDITIAGGGTTAWGDITGTLSGQTDLQAALDAKAAASHSHDTNAITSGTFLDARIAESNVTQHEAALSIASSQITAGGANTGDTLVFDGTNWVTNLTQLNKEVDDVGGTTIYIGEAVPGTATSSATWRIKRVVFTGDDSETLWADGDSNFNNVWDNRAALSYS
jgi:hypothetical protein